MAAAPTDILVPNAVLPERDWRPHATLLVRPGIGRFALHPGSAAHRPHGYACSGVAHRPRGYACSSHHSRLLLSLLSALCDCLFLAPISHSPHAHLLSSFGVEQSGCRHGRDGQAGPGRGTVQAAQSGCSSVRRVFQQGFALENAFLLSSADLLLHRRSRRSTSRLPLPPVADDKPRPRVDYVVFLVDTSTRARYAFAALWRIVRLATCLTGSSLVFPSWSALQLAATTSIGPRVRFSNAQHADYTRYHRRYVVLWAVARPRVRVRTARVSLDLLVFSTSFSSTNVARSESAVAPEELEEFTDLYDLQPIYVNPKVR